MDGKSVMSVRNVVSLGRLVNAIQPVMEKLEGRQLMSGDPLAYQNVIQTLPYSLNFNSPQNGVFDTNGLGTGFTRLQVNRLGTQYQQALINLNTSAGELDLTTQGTNTTGSNYGTDNTLVNALETQFDGTTSGFTITTRLKGPLDALNSNYDSGGVYFGPNDDNYIKFVAEYDSTKGQTLQFLDEQNATTHTVNSYQSIGSFANVTALDLRLTGDAATGKVTASYAVNGGAFTQMAGVVTLTGTEAKAFFNSAARAGILALSRNSLPPINVAFSHFEIDAGQAVSVTQPSIRFTNPAINATNVSVSQSIQADLNLPNSAINAATISGNTVYLYRSSDKSPVSAVVNTSGGGDSIILTPNAALAANTQYTFVVTSGVTDTSGAAMIPYTMSFTTGAAASQVDPGIQFQKVNLPSATGAAFTDVKIGPDGKLYASTEDGRIFRWVINADGTLQTPQIIASLQTANGGPRLITGFAFDPSFTAANPAPILWVSNSFFALSGATNGVDFTGKITVLSGANLGTVQDAVVNLPRSVADHSTEQPIFGPAGTPDANALFFAQASNTAYGAPDSTWGNRSEHLLTAAILRLDTTKITPGQPLNVLTPDASLTPTGPKGTYNPFAAGAALTIYATGVRNAFSLLFTADGTLWAPNNGSSSGGNTPAYNPNDPNQINGQRIDTGAPYSSTTAIPGLTNVQQTENDYLYRITQGGYYGHPNPTRGEYVLDGGNPATGGVADEVFSAYPSGTNPDPNYRGAAWDFGPHTSADSMIEYQDKTFSGALQGALFVTEYSAGSDIAILKRDASGNVVSETRGVTGLTGLNNPLSLVEDNNTGNLYVTELGGQRIVLLRAIAPHATASASQSPMVFNDIASAYTGGAGSSTAQSLTITNTGTATLNFAASGAFTFANDSASTTSDAGAFTITNLASLPTTLAPGASVKLNVTYTASRTGLQAAKLLIASNDPSGPLTVLVRGLGTTGTGGANEPSLPAILRAYGIPTITGDGVNDANMNQTFYPATPDASSQEVPMQRLAKAGDGPVTIQLLASFNAAGAANAPLVRFGYYTTGSTSSLDKNELFTLAQSDVQTTNPTALGSTSFDPGAASFGLYSIFPHFTDSGHPRVSYSEDALNTWDANVPRKVRFFPLKNSDGSVVPNAYVFAFEDNNIPFGSIQPYDSNDVIGIIRNVHAAANAVNAPAIGVENLDGAPSSTRMVFNRIQVPNATLTDVVHDTGNLLVRNTGSQNLVISALNLSDTANWQLVNPPTFPYTLAPGATLTVKVKFIAQNAPVHNTNQTNDTAVANDPGYNVFTAAGLWTGTLTIVTNDPVQPSKPIQLAGWWQHLSEHEEEPGIQTMVNMLYGYGTNIAPTQMPDLTEGASTPTYYGEEVVSAFWNVADPSQPITAIQLAAYHQQIDTTSNTNTAAVFGWYAKGSTSNTWVIRDTTANGQSLLPLNSTGGASVASFTPTAATFGWNLDGNTSDDTRNTVGGGGGHHVRFYPVRDSLGNLVPNTYIAALDYGSTTFENYDFQDNVYLITNMKPAGATPVPTDAQATAAPAGGINVQWAPVTSATLVGYNVYRSSTASGTFTKLNATPLTSANYYDASAPAGATSYYRITAVDGAGESPGANAFGQAIPGAPAVVTATAPSAGSIKLTWSAAVGVTTYHIERELVGGNGFVEIGSVTGTTFTDTALMGNTAYVYQIRSENSSGFSGYSPVAVATTPAGAAPGAPTLSSAKINASNQVVLTWSASTGTVTAYHIERKDPGQSTYTEIVGNLPGNATNFTDTTVQPGNSYSYRVRAENAGTLGNYSAVLSATTNIAGPSNLGAVAVSTSEIDLSWSPAPGTISFYHVERQLAGASTWTVLSDTVTTTSYQDTTAQPGGSYNYRVRADNNGSFSFYTAVASAATPSGPPQAPATVNAAVNTPTQITLTWTPASESVAANAATSYVIQRMAQGDAGWTTLASAYTNGTTFIDTSVQPGTTYTYQVAGQNIAGPGAFASAQATTPQPAYQSQDINSLPAGSTVTNIDGQSYDIIAGGTDIGSTSTDGFRYVYQQRNGDFDAVVQLQSLTATTPTTKAGIMVRATMDPGSPMVFIGATATSAYRWLYRTSANATPSFNAVGPVVSYPNVWVRLVRKANTYTGYYSTDGLNWTLAGSVTLPGLTNFGLAATSHTNSATTTAKFRSLSILTAPAAPTLSSTGTSASTISLSWNSIPNASTYTVMRFNTATSTYTSIAIGLTTTTFTDTGLTAGASYSYEVVAVNNVGSSLPSNVVTAQTQLATPTAPTLAPASNSVAGEIDLSWTAGAGSAATAYTIQRSTDNGQTWTTLSTTWTQLTYQDKSVLPNTTYTYQVFATNNAGSSPASNQVTATSQGAPAAPTNLTQTGSTSSSITIAWTASTSPGVTYIVQRKGPTDSGFVTISPANFAGTTFTDTGLTANTAYQYQVFAANAVGNSASPAGPLTFNTQVTNPAPGAPGTPTTTTLTTSKIAITWSAPTGTATLYHVMRSTAGGAFVEIGTSATTTYTDTNGIQPNTAYAYQVWAENNGTPGPASGVLNVSTPAPAFTSADIGATPSGSTTVINDGTDYDVTAGGPGIYGTADGGRFVYQQVTGNFDIKVQVTNITAAGTYPQAGLMARTDLSTGAMDVAITASSTYVTAGSYRFKYRSAPGAATTQTQGGGQANFPNTWVRLTRVGNVFTSYVSSNGTTWTQLGTVTLSTAPSTMLVGMVAASNVTTSTTTASFRNFSGL
ncbi:MAG: domain containing protein [Massilia sp.]|nr:domain containing protein [Massilia sp.]